VVKLNEDETGRLSEFAHAYKFIRDAVLGLWRRMKSINKHPNQEIQLDLSSNAATANPVSSVFALSGRNLATVKNLIELMAKNGLDFFSLIQPDDVILIKINEEWAERGGTDTDILKQLIQTIVSHPGKFVGEIVIADNGQWIGSMKWDRNNAENPSQSTQNVVDSFSNRYKVSTYDWMQIKAKPTKEYSEGDMTDGYVVYPNPDPITGTIVSYPKFQTTFGTSISFKHGIWNGNNYENKLKIINLPVLKSHNMYGVTGAVKAYIGVQSERRGGGLGNGHASIPKGGIGTLMAETRMPTLNIICATWVNSVPGNCRGAGPDTPYNVATRTNIIAASTDPVALDYWSSKNILVQAASKIGYSDTHTLDPDSKNRKGVETEGFGIWLSKTRDVLLKAGIQVTTNEKQINVVVQDKT